MYYKNNNKYWKINKSINLIYFALEKYLSHKIICRYICKNISVLDSYLAT